MGLLYLTFYVVKGAAEYLLLLCSVQSDDHCLLICILISVIFYVHLKVTMNAFTS